MEHTPRRMRDWALPGFQAFWGAQFLGALHDSVFKTVLTLVAIHGLSTPTESDTFIWLVQAVFVLPLIFFSAHAGWWADRYPKQIIIKRCKYIEMAIAIASAGCLWYFHPYGLLALFFLLSCRTVFFSPAKFAIIPELCLPHGISRANGWVEMGTFLAIVLGSAMAAFAYAHVETQPWWIGLGFCVMACGGWICSLGIPASGGPSVPTSHSAPRTLASDWKTVYRQVVRTKGVRSAILGLASFYAIGLIFQPALLLLADQVFHADPIEQGIWLSSFGIMMGLGSLLAGWVSGSKVEYGLIPLGAFGLSVGVFVLAQADTSLQVLGSLAWIGIASGFFIVPLHALIQLAPDPVYKGQVIAFSNMIQGIFMWLAVVLFWILDEKWGFDARDILKLLAVLGTLLAVITLIQEPRFFLRFLVCSMVRFFYRLRVLGDAHIPLKGPALLVCNHVTFIDGLVLASVFPRFLRFLIHQKYYTAFRPILQYCHGIPIESGNPELVAASIGRARDQLMAGHVVCIFAEGALTRTGHMMRFRSGFERIVSGLDQVPIIPVYLDQLWGSFFSHRDGKLFKRWPRLRRTEVIVSIGAPLPADSKAWQVRQVVQSLGADARLQANTTDLGLACAWWRAIRHRYLKRAIFEKGRSIRHIDLLIQAYALAQELRYRHGIEKQARVGICMPRSAYLCVVVVALTLAGCTIVLLPPDRSREWMARTIRRLQLRHICHAAQEENLPIPPEWDGVLIPLDNRAAVKKYSYSRRLFFRATFRPMAVDPHQAHVILLADAQRERDQAGAEALPPGTEKWVVLTHANIISAIQSLHQVISVNHRDRLLSVLSVHHVFGYVWNIWFPLLMGMGMILPRIKPDDWTEIAQLAVRRKATCVVGSPAVYDRYVAEFPGHTFFHLKYAIVGGDKVPDELYHRFAETFGKTLLEGFGLAETAGVLAINVPNVEQPDHIQLGQKAGSVGQLLPGTGVQIVDPMTWANKPPGEWGLLWVKGLNVMQGYWQTYSPIVSHGGERWLNTGLTASLDEEGFLFFPVSAPGSSA